MTNADPQSSPSDPSGQPGPSAPETPPGTADRDDRGEAPLPPIPPIDTESPRDRAKRWGEGVIGVLALAVLGHATVTMVATESAEVWWEYFWRAVCCLGVFVLQLTLVLDRPSRGWIWYGFGIAGVLMVAGLIGRIAT